MKNRSIWHIPLVVTVGQVAIFPYYIIWLKQVTLTFTLFAWLFALFSFSAAWGYSVYQSKKKETRSHIHFIYIGMGVVYIIIGGLKNSFELLLYIVVILQIILGFLQGYFRAWHVKQNMYSLHAVTHYLIVGFTMIGLSFVKIISPVVIIVGFGCVLCMCGLWDLINNKIVKS